MVKGSPLVVNLLSQRRRRLGRLSASPLRNYLAIKVLRISLLQCGRDLGTCVGASGTNPDVGLV